MALPQVALANDGGDVVCERCFVAETAFARLRGLLGRSGLSSGEGMLLRPTSSIHTAFMRFPIDAVFLDRSDRVVKVASDLRPWRMIRYHLYRLHFPLLALGRLRERLNG